MTTNPAPTREPTMAKHELDLNEDDLAAAAAFLETEDPTDTVNAALREVAEMHKRLEAWDRLAARGAAGQFDELLRKEQH